jgi:hypothetical protein
VLAISFGDFIGSPSTKASIEFNEFQRQRLSSRLTAETMHPCSLTHNSLSSELDHKVAIFALFLL